MSHLTDLIRGKRQQDMTKGSPSARPADGMRVLKFGLTREPRRKLPGCLNKSWATEAFAECSGVGVVFVLCSRYVGSSSLRALSVSLCMPCQDDGGLSWI